MLQLCQSKSGKFLLLDILLACLSMKLSNLKFQ